MNQLRLELAEVEWSVQGSARQSSPPVLAGVSLSLVAGEWLVLAGPSGGGKTTLLSIAAGLLRPTSGRVSIDGQDLSSIPEQALARLRADSVGMVFQSFHLDDSRDALDNILLPGYFSPRPWFELRERALELARALQLEQHLKKQVSVLSGGQKQRVAVARALLLRPKLLLADEPTGALDRPTAALVLDLFEREREHGAALLTVTHDPVVQERADRVLELADGSLRERVPSP